LIDSPEDSVYEPLVASGYFGDKVYLGLGVGGMERMIAYPALMWGTGFGGYLIAYPEERKN
jgi:hypothetical protein